MSSNFYVTIDEETHTYEPDMLDQALAMFFGAICSGAEAAELRWSA